MMQQTIVSLYLADCLMELAKTPGIYYLAFFNVFNYTLLQWTMNSVKKSNSKQCLCNFIYCLFLQFLKKLYECQRIDCFSLA